MTSLNKVAAASIYTLLTSFALVGSAGFIYVMDGMSAETLMGFIIGGGVGFGVGMVGTVGCIVYEECHPQSLERKNEKRLLMPPPKIVIETELSALPPSLPLSTLPPTQHFRPSSTLPLNSKYKI